MIVCHNCNEKAVDWKRSDIRRDQTRTHLRTTSKDESVGRTERLKGGRLNMIDEHRMVEKADVPLNVAAHVNHKAVVYLLSWLHSVSFDMYARRAQIWGSVEFE